ncbi:MAG: TetR/AcrR family transcriptional regulator [Culicoidibacterales bacterium]
MTTEQKQVRKPTQKRAILTKEKILNESRILFCKKGFYSTTTNEIAKVSGVSIGSLYSYFRDKDEILFELLHLHTQYYLSIFDTAHKTLDQLSSDPRKWLTMLIEYIISLHETTIDFSRELRSLYTSKPEVTEMMNRQYDQNRKMIFDILESHKQEFQVQDTEAFSYVLFNFINALVDSIVFFNHDIDRNRLISTGIDCLVKMM